LTAFTKVTTSLTALHPRWHVSTAKASKLVFVLTQIGKLLEMVEIETSTKFKRNRRAPRARLVAPQQPKARAMSNECLGTDYD